ncbi:MAG TPA: hypothetical protein VIC62_16145 [Nakamurella sp.]|jgi:hypothetical protein
MANVNGLSPAEGPGSGSGRRADVRRALRGLMRGALAAWRAAVTVDHLAPFVEPDLCTAHLAAA